MLITSRNWSACTEGSLKYLMSCRSWAVGRAVGSLLTSLEVASCRGIGTLGSMLWTPSSSWKKTFPITYYCHCCSMPIQLNSLNLPIPTVSNRRTWSCSTGSMGGRDWIWRKSLIPKKTYRSVCCRTIGAGFRGLQFICDFDIIRKQTCTQIPDLPIKSKLGCIIFELRDVQGWHGISSPASASFTCSVGIWRIKCCTLRGILNRKRSVPINSSPDSFHVPFFVTRIDEGHTFLWMTWPE